VSGEFNAETQRRRGRAKKRLREKGRRRVVLEAEGAEGAENKP
jgi:hypothetical protein